MQMILPGSPKEDSVAKLMRTAFLIGLALIWHPGAATGQYSWSNFSVSVGFGSGGVGFGVGAAYAAVDPWYDPYYADPCFDYAYYEWYRHACVGYGSFHVRQNYSAISVHRPHRYRGPSYYSPYGYYGYSGFSVSFGLNFGYGYPYYGTGYWPSYPVYGYPSTI